MLPSTSVNRKVIVPVGSAGIASGCVATINWLGARSARATRSRVSHSAELETAFAQLRFAASIVLGIPFSARALDRLVDPALTLALLAERRYLAGKKPRVSAISICPSYLGELVECGRLGYRPADFGLEQIFVGGEMVTAGLKARCRELFGAVEFVEGYGMTEPWPFGATLCEQGHLHFEPAHGLLELLDAETGAPAQPGEAGTLVLTPFPPFRFSQLPSRAG
jgi:acyl-CoA synthetase (AMP-forming)/AMP-acid ligase II